MPTLNIGGKHVQVGDDFLNLSPEEQNHTVEEIAGQLNVRGSASADPIGDKFRNPPDMGKEEGPGVVSAGLSGFNNALATAAGAPVDLMTGLVNSAAGDIMPGTYKDKQLIEHPFAGSEHLKGLMQAGKMADPREKIPEEMMPAYNVGDALGNAATMAAPVGIAGRVMGPAAQLAGDAGVLRGMAHEAATKPGEWAMREAGATAGAATGGAIAGAAMPDSEDANAAGQIAGSMLSPLAIAGRVAAPLGGPVKGAFEKLAGPVLDPVREFVAGHAKDVPDWVKPYIPQSAKDAAAAFVAPAEQNRLDNAARILKPQFEKGGEDVGQAVANLDAARAADGEGRGFLPVEQTKSPTLMGVQDQFAERNPEFGQFVKERTVEANKSLLGDADKVAGGGDAGTLLPQAQAEAEAHRRSIAQQVGAAEDAAREIADKAKLSPDPGVRAAANVQARDVLDQAFEAGKAQEGKLWRGLDLSQRIAPTNFREQLADLRKTAKILPGEQLPAPLQAAINYLGNSKIKAVTADVLQSTRSRLLEEARSAAAGANVNGAHVSAYKQLANGLLEDLAVVPGSATARSYSRALHQRWDRTFAGMTQQSLATGADKVRPGQTLERAMTGNAAQRAQNLADQRSAALPSYVGRDAVTPDMSPAVRAQQENFLRQHAASSIYDPNEGRINPKAAVRYAQDNAAALEQFPKLRQDILNAAEVTGGHLDQIDQLNRHAKLVEDQSAFGKVLKAGEDPAVAVTDALTKSKTPAADIRGLADLAARGGDEAKRGLLSTSWDVAVQKATKAKDGFWHGLNEQFHAPLSPNNPSLADTLHGAGVLNTTERARLKQVIARGMEMEKAAKNSRVLNDITPKISSSMDALLRLSGAAYMEHVSLLGHLFPANGLLKGQLGSKMMRQTFANTPRQQAMDLIQRSLKDPELLKRLLARTQTVGEKESMGNAFKAAADELRKARASGSINFRPSASTLGVMGGALH